MWKKPKLHSIEAPKDIKDILQKSIFWNSEGALAGSPQIIIFMYGLVLILFWGALYSILSLALSSFLSKSVLYFLILTTLLITALIIISYYFYQWGWMNYKEAWYYFDDTDEILTVVRLLKDQWEIIEIPYEEISEIYYTHGNNGKAIIRSMGFEFETNRAADKRESSVTDLWEKLARTDAKMNGWPIQLSCPNCHRSFGHHIGTAICPFCKIILLDDKVKGRIDPVQTHPNDMDRV
ncbi:MAG: hypothetical protein ACW98K_13580 [Candidatus Kariarchaeaceae archaeon]|jgi:Zn-dependent protease with chaperone function